MKKKLEKNIDKYLKKIKISIIGNRKKTKEFLEEFKQDIYDFVESNDIDDIDDITENFGSPEYVARSFWKKKALRKFNSACALEELRLLPPLQLL